MAVIEDPVVQLVIPGPGNLDDRIVFLGEDLTGRLLEVMAIEIEDGLLVIHAMDMRPKWKVIYEEGLT